MGFLFLLMVATTAGLEQQRRSGMSWRLFVAGSGNL
jgi:hypothetical protein